MTWPLAVRAPTSPSRVAQTRIVGGTAVGGTCGTPSGPVTGEANGIAPAAPAGTAKGDAWTGTANGDACAAAAAKRQLSARKPKLAARTRGPASLGPSPNNVSR